MHYKDNLYNWSLGGAGFTAALEDERVGAAGPRVRKGKASNSRAVNPTKPMTPEKTIEVKR